MNEVHIVFSIAICCILHTNLILAALSTTVPTAAKGSKETTKTKTDEQTPGPAEDFLLSLAKSFDESGMSEMFSDSLNKVALDIAKTEVDEASKNNGSNISAKAIMDDLPNIVGKYAKNFSRDFFDETIVKPAASPDSQDNMGKLIELGSDLFMKAMDQYQKYQDASSESTTSKSATEVSSVSAGGSSITPKQGKISSATSDDTKTTEKESITTEIPATTAEIPATTTETPATTTETPATTTEILAETTETPKPTTEEKPATEEPSTAAQLNTTPAATS